MRVVLGIMGLVGCAGFVLAQELSTDDALDQSRKRLMNGGSRAAGNGSQVTPVPAPPPKTIVVNYTVVVPPRQWTDLSGRSMAGRLLAFSAPKPGETGVVEVIREGKVRFLKAGAQKPADVPLEKLSEADQELVRKVAEAAQYSVNTTKPAAAKD